MDIAWGFVYIKSSKPEYILLYKLGPQLAIRDISTMLGAILKEYGLKLILGPNLDIAI